MSSVITNQKWFGILVGTDIDVDLRCKIAKGEINLCDDKNIFITAILLNRYKNDCQNVFISADILFEPNKAPERDTSKIMIGNILFGKGKFVLYVIQEYIRLNPDSTLADLQNAFPNRLQNPNGTSSKMPYRNRRTK